VQTAYVRHWPTYAGMLSILVDEPLAVWQAGRSRYLQEDELASAAETIQWEIRPWLIDLINSNRRLEAAAAAEVVRDAALKTTVEGLVAVVNAGGGNVDAAPILARIDEVAAKESATVLALQAQIAGLQERLTAAGAALGGP
jgi:hypothetical protein